MLINLIVAFVPFLFLNFKAMQFLIILIRTLFPADFNVKQPTLLPDPDEWAGVKSSMTTTNDGICSAEN